MSQTDDVGRDASGINDPPAPMHNQQVVEDACAAICEAIDQVAVTVTTIASAAGGLVAEIAEPSDQPDADRLSVAAQAAQQLASAADVFVGLGVGLAETRQRVLAGADRTINLVDVT